MKKTIPPDLKGKIALEAIKGVKPLTQIAQEYEVHPNVIGQWKKIVQENIRILFTDKRTKEARDKDDLIDQLYRTVGQRDIELAWLKKKLHLES